MNNRNDPFGLPVMFQQAWSKLAQLEPKKIVLDLGGGKLFPSLLWGGVRQKIKM
jgi:hypothetical protein